MERHLGTTRPGVSALAWTSPVETGGLATITGLVMTSALQFALTSFRCWSLIPSIFPVVCVCEKENKRADFNRRESLVLCQIKRTLV